MQKKISQLLFSSLLVLTFNSNAYSSEINLVKNQKPINNTYKLTESVLDYQPDPSSPYLRNYKKELLDKKVDTGKAMGLSGLYFGLGQIYSGDTNRGALILAGGTLLTATVLLVLIPTFANRQQGVTATAGAISYGTLGIAYVLNIRDAYTTAERINKDIDEKLLYSNTLIKELDKVSVETKNQSFGLSYKALSF